MRPIACEDPEQVFEAELQSGHSRPGIAINQDRESVMYSHRSAIEHEWDDQCRAFRSPRRSAIQVLDDVLETLRPKSKGRARRMAAESCRSVKPHGARDDQIPRALHDCGGTTRITPGTMERPQ